MNRKITGLAVQKRNPNRVNVYLDGEFAFGLARIVAAWLEIGQELSPDKITSLQAEDAREVTYQQALRLLNIRPRTEAEIRRNLVKHGASDEDIEATIQRLKDGGLIDDQRFAQVWIENRSALRPRGRRALTFELRQRGIAAEDAQTSLEGLDEESLAYQAAQKQARKLHGLDQQAFKHKMLGFLARRGFDYQASAAAAAQVWAELIQENMDDEEVYDDY